MSSQELPLAMDDPQKSTCCNGSVRKLLSGSALKPVVRFVCLTCLNTFSRRSPREGEVYHSIDRAPRPYQSRDLPESDVEQ